MLDDHAGRLCRRAGSDLPAVGCVRRESLALCFIPESTIPARMICGFSFPSRPDEPHLQLEQASPEQHHRCPENFMCLEATSENRRRANALRVDWHDCAWSPPITVQPPARRAGRRDKTIARRRRDSAYWLSLKSSQNHENHLLAPPAGGLHPHRTARRHRHHRHPRGDAAAGAGGGQKPRQEGQGAAGGAATSSPPSRNTIPPTAGFRFRAPRKHAPAANSDFTYGGSLFQRLHEWCSTTQPQLLSPTIPKSSPF